MKSKIIIGIVAAVAVLGGGYTVSRMDFIGTGKVGIVYNYKDGVQDTVLTTGMHFIAPMNKVKEFSTSNEILVLTKDKRDGSKEDDSFKVATSDDASITVSFQMSYIAILDEQIELLKVERLEKARCYQKIERQIKQMENEDEQEVLRLRYITGLKWEEVALKMNYSWKWIHKIHGRALQNFKI